MALSVSTTRERMVSVVRAFFKSSLAVCHPTSSAGGVTSSKQPATSIVHAIALQRDGWTNKKHMPLPPRHIRRLSCLPAEFVSHLSLTPAAAVSPVADCASVCLSVCLGNNRVGPSPWMWPRPTPSTASSRASRTGRVSHGKTWHSMEQRGMAWHGIGTGSTESSIGL